MTRKHTTPFFDALWPLWLGLLGLTALLAGCQANGKTEEDASAARRQAFQLAHPGFAPSFESRIDSLYRAFGLRGDLLLGVVDEGGLAYLYAIPGKALDSYAPLTADSPIYLASHTKAMTGTLLAMMEEEGVLRLDSTMHAYMPTLDFGGAIDTRAITLQQLLNHSHGIHSPAFTWKTAYLGYEGGNQALIRELNHDYRYDSAQQFSYSNTGPMLAAMAAETVTGESWKAAMAQRIFEPLGMANTSARVSRYAPNTIRPSVTVAPDQRIFQKGFFKTDATMHASGGVISTVNDLATWVQANLRQDARLLSPQGWAKLHAPTVAQQRDYFTYKRFGYSLGWDLSTYNTDTLLTRFGGFAGISLHVSIMPSERVGIIAFGNDSRATLMPHVIANYAYNLMNDRGQSYAEFLQELGLFAKNFATNSARLLPENSRHLHPGTTPEITGHFANAQGWPPIDVEETDTNYRMRWGVLEGPVYILPNGATPDYMANLGALIRTFRVEGDTLYTGSLLYTRQP